LLGLSQERLGEAVGLTFQQIQKYERGANRIGASRMYDLAHVLDVPVSFFFEDMPDDVKQRDAAPPGSPAAEEAVVERNPLNRRETLELVRAYYRIGSARVRKRVFELVKAVARVEEPD
jgi:transcriptional regulator with XRE-family HTH domain